MFEFAPMTERIKRVRAKRDVFTSGKYMTVNSERTKIYTDYYKEHENEYPLLKRSGALADMKRRGIKSVFFFQVDNPLVEIADPAFIGYHVMEKSDYSLKLCAKRDPKEKVGMPMRFGDSFRMVEYTEMTEELLDAKDADGNYLYNFGVTLNYLFSFEALRRAERENLPYHLAKKKIACIDEK